MSTDSEGSSNDSSYDSSYPSAKRRRLDEETQLENALHTLSRQMLYDEISFPTYKDFVEAVGNITFTFEVSEDKKNELVGEIFNDSRQEFLSFLDEIPWDEPMSDEQLKKIFSIFENFSNFPYAPDPIESRDITTLVSRMTEKEKGEYWWPLMVPNKQNNMHLLNLLLKSNVVEFNDFKEILRMLFYSNFGDALMEFVQTQFTSADSLHLLETMKRATDALCSEPFRRGKEHLFQTMLNFTAVLKDVIESLEDDYLMKKVQEYAAKNDAQKWLAVVQKIISRTASNEGHLRLHHLLPVMIRIFPTTEPMNNRYYFNLAVMMMDEGYTEDEVEQLTLKTKMEIEEEQYDASLTPYLKTFNERPSVSVDTVTVGHQIGPDMFLGRLENGTGVFIKTFTDEDKFNKERDIAAFINCQPGFSCFLGTGQLEDGSKTIVYPSMEPLPAQLSQNEQVALVWTLIKAIYAMRLQGFYHGHLRHSMMIMPRTNNQTVVAVGNLGNLRVTRANEMLPMFSVQESLDALTVDVKDAAQLILDRIRLDPDSDVAIILNKIIESSNPFVVWYMWDQAVQMILFLNEFPGIEKDDANFELIAKRWPHGSELEDVDITTQTVRHALKDLGKLLTPSSQKLFLESVLETPREDPQVSFWFTSDVVPYVKELLKEPELEPVKIAKEPFPCANNDYDYVTGEPFPDNHDKSNMIFVTLNGTTYCMSMNPDAVRGILNSDKDEQGNQRKDYLTFYVDTYIIRVRPQDFDAIIQAMSATDHVLNVVLQANPSNIHTISSIS